MAVVGVHVQINVDQRPRRQLARQRCVSGQRLAPVGHLRVDRFDLVGNLLPAARRGRRAEPLAQSVVVQQS